MAKHRPHLPRRTKMTNAELLQKLTLDLQSVYGCHTAILYGSRARDDWDAASDIDVIAFRDHGESDRVAEKWNGAYLDLFIYKSDESPDPSWIRINDGRVLFQARGFGDQILETVQKLFADGPEPVPIDELRVRKVWAEKMLQRSEKGDAEGNYRRHWLLFMLLEDYFAVRGRWYLGPKKSLRSLRETNGAHFAAFETALRPDASIEDVQGAIDATFEGS
jgi:predicted nucleotidyltransferase